ncbi:hypothetical protein CXU01_12125 [Akkermansia muciniphila]|nr:hypothetical protein [Akkermansia muciniphila]MBE5698588.1 hypothetical protein [Akkermansia sp.]PNC52293.1 hypothetical protein CXU06_11340 [Akkermansia muciniphila]PNC78503.1 hypothetical protein CXU01_12125 [Akkermansia muciniphila]PNC90131.1 hypothetical protein CXU03_00880 [Akkermansia muciniphila]
MLLLREFYILFQQRCCRRCGGPEHWTVFQTTRRKKIKGAAPPGNGNGKRPRGGYNGNCRQQSVPLREDKHDNLIACFL